jgi:DNA polymerase-3 subunit gamma/tau
VSELRRLFDAEPDDFATALLRSAEDDAPNARSFSQAARALGVSALLAGAAVAPSAAASSVAATGAVAAGTQAAVSVTALAGSAGYGALTVAVLAKHVAIGMVAGVAVMGGFYTAVGVPGSNRAPAREAVHAQAPAAGTSPRGVSKPQGARAAFPALPEDAVVAVPTEAVAPVAEQRPPSGAEPRNVAPLARPRAPAVVSEPAPPPAAAPPVETPQKAGLTLAGEVALLDRAQKALRGGDALGSLALLDEYRGAQRSNVLVPEAEVLRIQALDRVGRQRAAAELARSFIRQNPGSRHAAALRPLAERADAAP